MAIKVSNQITFTEHKKIVEIKEYYLATSQNEGITIETAGWTTDIQTIDYTNKYLWNYEEVIYSIGSSEISEPVIIGFYGKGDTGKGISNIVNYYQITQNLVAPELPTANENSSWKDSSIILNLSPTNKYLWNYESIIYTDGSVTNTEPAIIGVYGDSGTNAITFEIYSSKGFMFKEGLKEITLQIAAFEGSDAITDATYKWEWWDSREDAYSTIVASTTNKTLIVTDSQQYALASLKCTMTYNGKNYEDYVTLTNETVVYTSVVKFFDGRNIFYADDLYLVAYIELYQNNNKIETIFANKYCSGLSKISNGIITANVSGSFANGDKMYFICQNSNGLYEVVLGEYTSGMWKVMNVETEYTYNNSLYPNIHSNVIAISKESVNKSVKIDFEVLKDNIYISDTSVNIIDSNDPIIGENAPDTAIEGQLWLDTSSTPHTLKIYTNAEWVNCSEKIGGAVFTSQPSSYAAGDLWILANGEKCGDFGPGSMLKATTTASTFNTSHWIDADEETTELKANIKQYFGFDPNTGLRIGQTDEKFYVNISSTEMGFYDNSNNQNQKVVSIANNAATIRNLTVQGSATFVAPVTFEQQINLLGFIFKKESNGSLSLAIDK